MHIMRHTKPEQVAKPMEVNAMRRRREGENRRSVDWGRFVSDPDAWERDDDETLGAALAGLDADRQADQDRRDTPTPGEGG